MVDMPPRMICHIPHTRALAEFFEIPPGCRTVKRQTVPLGKNSVGFTPFIAYLFALLVLQALPLFQHVHNVLRQL